MISLTTRQKKCHGYLLDKPKARIWGLFLVNAYRTSQPPRTNEPGGRIHSGRRSSWTFALVRNKAMSRSKQLLCSGGKKIKGKKKGSEQNQIPISPQKRVQYIPYQKLQKTRKELESEVQRIYSVTHPTEERLRKLQKEPFFTWPKPMITDPEKRKKDKYYNYHRDHGHETKKCQSLLKKTGGVERRGKDGKIPT